MTKTEAADRAGGMTREEYADQFLAARAMLAALKHARDEVHNPGAFRFSAQSANGRHDIGDYLEAAIAAAEAAGIKGEE